jgi:hypothetical protein
VLVTEVDGGSMDAGADDSDDDSGSMEENLDNDDLQIGMPLYGSTMGDVDPEPQAVTGTHGQSRSVSHGQSPQESWSVTGEVMDKSWSVMVNESW